MKKLFLITSLLLTFAACDDGDLIVTSFAFEDVELEQCGDLGEFIFFKINNENLETLSLKLAVQDPILTTVDTISYSLDGSSNVVNYRTYSGSVSNSYFCSLLPPTDPEILTNYVSNSGSAKVMTTIISEPGSTPITYSIRVILENIVLQGAGETIIQEVLELGVVQNTVN